LLCIKAHSYLSLNSFIFYSTLSYSSAIYYSAFAINSASLALSFYFCALSFSSLLLNSSFYLFSSNNSSVAPFTPSSLTIAIQLGVYSRQVEKVDLSLSYLVRLIALPIAVLTLIIFLSWSGVYLGFGSKAGYTRWPVAYLDLSALKTRSRSVCVMGALLFSTSYS
jgi:hypothetical protein